MPLIRQSIPALYGGVSQQAASVRSLSQCQDATNCLFTVAEGASKRPPLELVAPLVDIDKSYFEPLLTGGLADIFWHDVPFPNTDGFVLMVDGQGAFKVFKVVDGILIGAVNDSAQDYLINPDVETRRTSESFACVTVGRTTYIVNRTMLVKMSEDLLPGTLGGTAQTLQDTILDAAADGSIYQILGDESNTYDTYYAKRVGGKWVEWAKPGVVYKFDATTMPHKLEIIEDPVEPLGYRAEFNPVEWSELMVGDAKSNKLPSVVGARINGVFFAHDRLGMLADNGVTLSETGEYANLMRTTVTDVLDTDRIDVKVSSDGSSTLNFARPLGKSIILFADSREFSLDGTPIFSPRTVSSTQATAYPSSRICEPVTSGPNCYFASDTSNAGVVWEMFVQDDAVTNDATNITAHVPNYLPGNIDQIVVNNTFDSMLVRVGGSAVLYHYQAYWQGDQKVQSAWGRWVLGARFGSIAHMFATRDYVYAVFYYEETAATTGIEPTIPVWKSYLCRWNMKASVPTVGLNALGHVVHMDMLHKPIVVYDAGTETSTFTCGFPFMASLFRESACLVVATGINAGKAYGLTNPGPVVINDGATTNSFTIAGDWTTAQYYIGCNYEFRYTFSEQFWFEGDRPVLNSRTQMRNMSVNFQDTAYFATEVDVLGHDTAGSSVIPALTSQYTARTLGAEDFRLNRPQFSSGTYRFPILGKSSEVSISLINTEYTPCHFITAEWEGLVTTRTKR